MLCQKGGAAATAAAGDSAVPLRRAARRGVTVRAERGPIDFKIGDCAALFAADVAAEALRVIPRGPDGHALDGVHWCGAAAARYVHLFCDVDGPAEVCLYIVASPERVVFGAGGGSAPKGVREEVCAH